MKKTILLSAIALLSFSSFAQSKDSGADAGITYGVKAGVSFATVSVGSFYDEATVNAVTSFYVGGVVNIPVHSMIAVQPGLTFIGKGGKLVNKVDKDKYFQVTPVYLEVPVNVVANFEVGPGKVLVGLGPYVSFGIGGKIKGVENGITKESDLKFGTNTDTDQSKDLKSLDFGLNFMVGYQLSNGLSFNAGYSLGLTDISPLKEQTSDTSIKNSVITVGLGFNF